MLKSKLTSQLPQTYAANFYWEHLFFERFTVGNIKAKPPNFVMEQQQDAFVSVQDLGEVFLLFSLCSVISKPYAFIAKTILNHLNRI